jgi:hypothetical protein
MFYFLHKNGKVYQVSDLFVLRGKRRMTLDMMEETFAGETYQAWMHVDLEGKNHERDSYGIEPMDKLLFCIQNKRYIRHDFLMNDEIPDVLDVTDNPPSPEAPEGHQTIKPINRITQPAREL